LIPFYGAASEGAVRHKIGGATAQLMQKRLAIGCDGAADAEDDHEYEDLGDIWNVYPEGLTPGFVSGLDSDVWAQGGRPKSYENSLAIRGVHKRRRRKKEESGPRPCTKIVAQPPCNIEKRLRDHKKGEDDKSIEQAAIVDDHPMFINAPPLPPPKISSGRSARFFRPALEIVEDEGSWGQTMVQKAPMHRKDRRRRGVEEEQDFWNMLNVPFDVPKKKIGEVDHERVWCIASALAEQLADKLPALTAG
jgi:hypothetical protein